MDESKVELVRGLMGASHIFCSTVDDLLERTLAEVSHQQLAMSQVKLLLLISRSGKRFKVSDVADILEVTNAAASRAIDRLVQRGLVDRAVVPEDRRAVSLSLTEESRRLLERFGEARMAELMDRLADMPAEKLRLATSLMEELSVMMLGLGDEREEKCLNCRVHFRTGCVLRDVVGRECAVSSQLYGDPPEPAEVEAD